MPKTFIRFQNIFIVHKNPEVMLKSKIFIHFLMIMLISNLASAATVHGTVYDLSLKKLNNVRVEINTSPKQLMVAQNGSYSFNAPYGTYIIKAQLMQRNNLIASSEENITIRQDGNYVLDIILFPNVEEGVENIDIDVNGDLITIENNKNMSLGIIVFLLFAIILATAYYFIKRKNKKVEEQKKEDKYEGDSLGQLIRIIKQEGGRTTQKDIRKQIPLSEAKISLMIAELEHKGVIEKIKKGRGNIIILRNK